MLLADFGWCALITVNLSVPDRFRHSRNVCWSGILAPHTERSRASDEGEGLASSVEAAQIKW